MQQRLRRYDEANDLKMGRLSGWALNTTTNVLREGYFMKHRRGKGSESMEAEMGVMQSQAKECWQPPGASRGKETDGPLVSLWREHRPADTLILVLILNFWSPEL